MKNMKTIYVVGAVLIATLAYVMGCGSAASTATSSAAVDTALGASIPTQVDSQSSVTQ